MSLRTTSTQSLAVMARSVGEGGTSCFPGRKTAACSERAEPESSDALQRPPNDSRGGSSGAMGGEGEFAGLAPSPYKKAFTSSLTAGERKLPCTEDTPLGGCAGSTSMPMTRPPGWVRSSATWAGVRWERRRAGVFRTCDHDPGANPYARQRVFPEVWRNERGPLPSGLCGTGGTSR